MLDGKRVLSVRGKLFGVPLWLLLLPVVSFVLLGVVLFRPSVPTHSTRLGHREADDLRTLQRRIRELQPAAGQVPALAEHSEALQSKLEQLTEAAERNQNIAKRNYEAAMSWKQRAEDVERQARKAGIDVKPTKLDGEGDGGLGDQQQGHREERPDALYTIHEGFLEKGNDVLGSEDGRFLSVDQAKDLCLETADCVGFTFKDDGDDHRQRIFFKSEWSFKPAPGWKAFQRKLPLPTGTKGDATKAGNQTRAGPGKPLKELPLKVKNGTDFIADYDVEAVMLDNGFGPLSKKWPEYNDQAPGAAFRYASLPDDLPRPKKMALLSVAPRIYYLPDFMSEEEINGFIKAAEPKLERSRVALKDEKAKGNGGVTDIRTSYQTWLNDDVPAVKAVRERISRVTGFKTGDFESMQVLRYVNGQQYKAHHDFFHPRAYGMKKWNRVVTVFLYLTTVTEGGETSFPRTNGAAVKGNGCDQGLRVKPKKGSAVIFYDMRPDKNLDPFSLHSGCPVKGDNVKWGGTQWIRLPLPDGVPPESRV